jgi:hypothetical protein
MHIPKCGGTGVIEGLRRYYNPSNVFRLDAPASSNAMKLIQMEGGINEYRSILLIYAMSSEQYKLIAGHFLFDERAYLNFGERWKFITIIRDPVSRFISHYFFNKYNKSNHFRINDELEIFLQKPESEELGKMMLKYFSGSLKNANIVTAGKNLKKFDIIGTLETVEKFYTTMSIKYKIDIDVIHSNKNPKSIDEQQRLLSPEIIEKITSLCQPDIELYNLIKDTYDV